MMVILLLLFLVVPKPKISQVKVTVAFSKSLPREKNIIPSRGGYPAGSRPFVHGRGETGCLLEADIESE